MVGHVDLKFVLNSNTMNIPQIQVTLLKNKAPGLGKATGEDLHSLQSMMTDVGDKALVASALISKCASPTEAAVDRQISFPLSNMLHVNGERNNQPLLHDFPEDIQFMDIEETSGLGRATRPSPLQFGA